MLSLLLIIEQKPNKQNCTQMYVHIHLYIPQIRIRVFLIIHVYKRYLMIIFYQIRSHRRIFWDVVKLLVSQQLYVHTLMYSVHPPFITLT